MRPLPRRAVTVATGTVLALTLAACSQGSATRTDTAADGTTTVRYMNFSANDGHEEDLAKIVDAFEAEHSDITVEVETVPYADYFTKLQTAVAGGTVADTFELNYENFVTYAENGSLAELSGVDAGTYKESLLEAFSRDGKQYALPESFSDVVLFYNKDLFDAAGVEAPTADWTWADEQAAAEKLTDKAAGVWGDFQPISFHEFYKALAQNGGQFLSADGSEASFAGPEGVEAAQWLVGKAGTTMPTAADGAGTPDFDSNLFSSGKLAMWHTGIWMFGALADVDFAWDIVVEPGNTQKASAMFTNGVAVSATSEHPEAAQQWLEFLTASDTTVDTRLATGWELPPVADDSQLASYLEQTPPANRQAVVDALEATVLPPVIERQQEMQDVVTEELGNAAAGRKSVEQALAHAQEKVNSLLG
jgi:multiple sugar transport system substrate-binding protein